jgi:putative ABC transport system permease protein
MFALTLRNLWAYKRRLLTSAFSVVLGIAFLSGSFVFTDTLKGLFTDLFSSAVKGIDVVVRAAPGLKEQGRGGGDDGGNDGPYGGRALVESKLVSEIRNVPGVAAVEASSQGYAQVIDKEKKLIRNGGAPTFGNVWIYDTELSSYRIYSGRPPKADNEVVIDRAVMKTAKFKVGDKVKIVSALPQREFVISGDATFGSADGALGATAVFFNDKTAQELLSAPGQAQQILVRAKAGTTQDQLAASIKSALASKTAVGGGKLEAITGLALEKETQSFVNQIFNVLNIFFNAFAFIALFVSIFVISNSFSIVVKQRTREMAMLRTIGAGRSQILLATFFEALLVGVLASAVGVFGGLGVAIGIRKLIEAFGGGGLPSSGLVLQTRTIVWGMLVGTIVTVLSAIAPAIKASRVKPLAALRDTEIDDAGFSKVRMGIGALFLLGSGALLMLGLQGKGGDGAKIVGIGAGLALIGVIFVGPVLARPVAGTLGRAWFGVFVGLFGVLTILGSVGGFVVGIKKSSPNIVLSSLFGIPIGLYLIITALASPKVSGQIARQNAIRNPSRTSATALALTIGTGLVSAILLLSTSLTNTFTGVVDRAIKADFIISSSNDFGLPNEVSDRVAKLPGTVASSGQRRERMNVASAGLGFGRNVGVAAVDPESFTKVFNLGTITGSFDDLKNPDTVAIATDSVNKYKYKIGDTLAGSFRTGTEAKWKIVAFYENAEGLGNTYFVTGEQTMNKYVPGKAKNIVYLRSDGKDAKAFEKSVKAALDDIPTASIKTKKGYEEAQLGQFNLFLGLINALLFLAILIAILGIANTLRLSILERRREIGLLRAVGMSRQQMKDSIRWEAIVVATFGAVLGVIIGTGFGAALVYVLGKDGGLLKLSIPWPFLIGLTGLASLVGLYAARKPAKDAAKLNILQAIATEG